MISLDELRTFHNIDRQVYARFVFQLGQDSDASKKIVALWNWLETVGYRNFTHNSLELPPTMFRQLAAESTLCLNALEDLIFLHVAPGDCLPLMSLVGQKALSLEFLYTNREIVKKEVTKFIRRVCDDAFSDIVPPNLNNQMQVLEPVVTQVQEDNGIIGNQLINEEDEEDEEEGEDNEEDSRIARTLFVTFSRGHPISREQLANYFKRKYGENCIEDLVMKDLYALLIVSSLFYVRRILGKRNLLQFSIRGKDVRARKYVRKDAVPPN